MLQIFSSYQYIFSIIQARNCFFVILWLVSTETEWKSVTTPPPDVNRLRALKCVHCLVSLWGPWQKKIPIDHTMALFTKLHLHCFKEAVFSALSVWCLSADKMKMTSYQTADLMKGREVLVFGEWYIWDYCVLILCICLPRAFWNSHCLYSVNSWCQWPSRANSTNLYERINERVVCGNRHSRWGLSEISPHSHSSLLYSCIFT